MIIDADCHISSHKFDGLAITADELVEHMDRAGSDMPFRLMHVILAMYRAMLRDFDETEQAKILGGNLARLLKLE